jgi:uncharacterized protein DUF6334
MNENVAIPTAEALYGTLSEFHTLAREPLRSVRCVFDEKSLDRVILVFDQMSLSVAGNPDDDSVEFRVAPNSQAENVGSVDASHLDHWKSLIGRPFGWGWITINQQGYCDGVLISFDGIHPQLLLTVAASSVIVSTVTRL